MKSLEMVGTEKNPHSLDSVGVASITRSGTIRPTNLTFRILFWYLLTLLPSLSSEQVQTRTMTQIDTTLTLTPAVATTGIADSMADLTTMVGGIYGDAASNTVLVFGSSTTNLGSIVVVPALVNMVGVNYVGSGGTLVIGENVAVVYYDMQWTSPSFAFVQNAANSVLTAHNKKLYEQAAILPNKTYAIMNIYDSAGATPKSQLIKYAIAPALFTTIVNNNPYLGDTNQLTSNLNTISADYFSAIYLTMYVYTTINLGLIKTIPLAANAAKASGLSDSKDWMIFYQLVTTTGSVSTQVVKINITEKDTGVVPSTGSPYTMGAPFLTNSPMGMVQISSLSLLGLFVNESPMMTLRFAIFLYKRDLTVYWMMGITTPPTDAFAPRTAVAFPDLVDPFSYYIGSIVMEGGVPSFYAYQLQIDKCDLVVQSTCRKCEPDYYRTLQDDPASSCVSKPNFLPGYGADEVSNMVKPCENIGCLTCINNYTQCTLCDTNFQIVNNACKPFVPINLTLVNAPKPINYSDFTFWVLPSLNFTYASFPEIAKNISIQVEMYTVGKRVPLDKNVTSVVKVIRNQVLELQVTIHPLLRSLDTIMSINFPNDTDIIQDGITYKFKAFWNNFTLKEPYLTFGYNNEMKKYLNYAYAMGYVMGAEVTSQMLVFYIDLALVMDPTQIGVRMVQSYKIYNRLKYINVQFGGKLEAFLQNIGEILIGPQEYSKDVDVRKPTGTKGKLTTLKLGLDFSGLYTARLFIYICTFSLRFFSELVVKKRMEVQIWLLAIAFYAPRLHCIVLNLICVDFMFYGFRDLLHMSGTDFPNIMAFFAIIFITWDFSLLFMSATNDRNWSMEFHIQNRGFAQSGIEDVIVVTESDSDEDEENENGEEKEKKKTVQRAAVDSIEEAKIDYQKTFIELGRDAGAIWFLTRNLRLDKEVYNDRWCRFYGIFKMLKTCFYSSTIIGCQFAPITQSLVYILMEISLMAYIVYKFLKLKFISPFLLTIDLLQGCALFMFAMLTMSIYTEQAGKTHNSDSTQITMCFVVILATIGEYFLSWVEAGFVFWNYLQSLKGSYASSYSWLRFLYRDLGYYDYVDAKMHNQPYKLSKTFFSAGQRLNKKKVKPVKSSL